MDFQALNGRMCRIRLRGRFQVTLKYLKDKSEEEKEMFYETVEQTIQQGL